MNEKIPRPVDHVPSAPAEAARQPRPLHGIAAVVVDDRADQRDLLTVILESAGADVRTAGSVDEALGVIRQHHPRIVVSDLAMPARDGCALVRELRLIGRESRGIAAIALTAMARPEDRTRALAAGFDAYMTKPTSPDALVAAIVCLVFHNHHDAPTSPAAASPSGRCTCQPGRLEGRTGRGL